MQRHPQPGFSLHVHPQGGVVQPQVAAGGVDVQGVEQLHGAARRIGERALGQTAQPLVPMRLDTCGRSSSAAHQYELLVGIRLFEQSLLDLFATGTLAGTILLNVPFGWLVKKLPRSRFIPLILDEEGTALIEPQEGQQDLRKMLGRPLH